MVAQKLCPYSVYTSKLARKGIELRGGKDINVLKSHTVQEIMDPQFETVPASSNLQDLFHRIEKSKESYFIVVDRKGHLSGILSFQDIRSLLSEHTLDYLVIAQDVVARDTVTLQTSDDLDKAYALFSRGDFALIPVLDAPTGTKVVGVVRRESLIDYYNRRLIERLRQ